MFGVVRLDARFLAARFFGARFFDNPALRGERDLRAMIPHPGPAAACHGQPGRVTPEATFGLRFACGELQAN
jgi:hypothetical protein